MVDEIVLMDEFHHKKLKFSLMDEIMGNLTMWIIA